MAESQYAIVFSRSALKEIRGLERTVAQRVWPRIEQLAADPRPTGCVKLSGYETLWRIRVGDYRVIYDLNDASRVVDIVAVRHRRDAYR